MQIQVALTRTDFQLAVDLALPDRGITVLFGPSGSGKTSLLRCVAGLEPARGLVAIGNDTWLDTTHQINRPTWQRELGFVFQEPSLFGHLNVHDNLKFGTTRVGSAQALTALSQAIELLGLRHLLNRSVDSLSGGERQRVAIARALATQPKLLLLDEPLASLDYRKKREIMPWLEHLHQELEIPVLYVTHSISELKRLADHVVLLHDGQATRSGPADAVIAGIDFSTLD